ncbi:hypothetical protein EVAR_60002_1 [Eumeta japonica]|uniref:Uncharacterized protein n=1 Tax=Eumeta variegata TaxID=151549 RepID=A0A4C1ZCX2_EUMVA|nr:hypothetical protein EVAR_60002_1 [Eumeta japonica]
MISGRLRLKAAPDPRQRAQHDALDKSLYRTVSFAHYISATRIELYRETLVQSVMLDPQTVSPRSGEVVPRCDVQFVVTLRKFFFTNGCQFYDLAYPLPLQLTDAVSYAGRTGSSADFVISDFLSQRNLKHNLFQPHVEKLISAI